MCVIYVPTYVQMWVHCARVYMPFTFSPVAPCYFHQHTCCCNQYHVSQVNMHQAPLTRTCSIHTQYSFNTYSLSTYTQLFNIYTALEHIHSSSVQPHHLLSQHHHRHHLPHHLLLHNPGPWSRPGKRQHPGPPSTPSSLLPLHAAPHRRSLLLLCCWGGHLCTRVCYYYRGFLLS